MHPLRRPSHLLLVAVAVLASACTANEPPEPAAEQPPPAKRIISLAPNLTEILFALNLGPHIVGVTNHCDFPPEALEKRRVGGFVNPDLETVVGLEPDLVLATPNVGNKDTVLRMESFGIEFLIVDPDSLAGLFQTIQAIGARTGAVEAADLLVEDLESEIAAVRSRVQPLAPRGAFIVFSRDPLIVAGPGTFFDELLVTAGGINLAAGAGTQFPQFSLEEVVRLGPQVIIDTVMGSDSGSGSEFWDRWDSIPAVRDRQICNPPADVITRPGPRVAEGLALLAQCLHPESRADHELPGDDAS